MDPLGLLTPPPQQSLCPDIPGGRHSVRSERQKDMLGEHVDRKPQQIWCDQQCAVVTGDTIGGLHHRLHSIHFASAEPCRG